MTFGLWAQRATGLLHPASFRPHEPTIVPCGSKDGQRAAQVRSYLTVLIGRSLSPVSEYFGWSFVNTNSSSPGLIRPSSSLAISSIARGSSWSRLAVFRRDSFSARNLDKSETRIACSFLVFNRSIKPFSPAMELATRMVPTDRRTVLRRRLNHKGDSERKL